MRPMVKIKLTQGFTLLEVLIAVAVLAIISVGLYNVGAVNTLSHQRIQDKTLAHWVALNKVVEFEYFEAFPSPGIQNYSADMAGKTWQIQATVIATDHNDVRQIQIAVGEKPQTSREKFAPAANLLTLIKRRQ